MKLTLKNGTNIDVIDVEETYYPRNTQGTILSIRLDSTEDIESIKAMFAAAVTDSITVGEGDEAKVITGYNQVDSIRKFYTNNANVEYNTAIDLIKVTE